MKKPNKLSMTAGLNDESLSTPEASITSEEDLYFKWDSTNLWPKFGFFGQQAGM